MEMNHDEDLQRRIEAGDKQDQSVHAEYYRTVFKALRREPGYELPQDFAARVARNAVLGNDREESSADRWWWMSGIVILLGGLGYLLTRVSFRPGVGVFTFISSNAGLIIFGIFFVIGLHFVDRFLLRPARSQNLY